jgi:hypothetical protein
MCTRYAIVKMDVKFLALLTSALDYPCFCQDHKGTCTQLPSFCTTSTTSSYKEPSVASLALSDVILFRALEVTGQLQIYPMEESLVHILLKEAFVRPRVVVDVKVQSKVAASLLGPKPQLSLS